jgi:exonuclease VII large subunit
MARLHALSPLEVLDRGYAIAFRAESGKAARKVAELPEGELFRLALPDGAIDARSLGPAAAPGAGPAPKAAARPRRPRKKKDS